MSPHDAISKVWGALAEIHYNVIHKGITITVNSTTEQFDKAKYCYELPAITDGVRSHIDIRSDDDLSD